MNLHTKTAVLVLTIVPASVVLLGHQQPRFRSGVDVVLIDVNVVDHSGKPIADLKPEDFTVSVDRKPRTIASAAFLEYGMRVSTAPEGAERPAPPPAPPRAAQLSRPPRQFIIVVDEDSLEIGEARAAANAATTLLDRLVPTDRVGIITIPRVQQITNLTTDRAEARQRLDRVMGGFDQIRPTPPLRIGLWEAFEVASGDEQLRKKVKDRNCALKDPETGLPGVLPGLPGCVTMVDDDLRQMFIQSQMRTTAGIETLRDLAFKFGKIPGPKTLVLVSGGMTKPESNFSYSELDQAFAAAQITFYTVFIERPDYSAAANWPSPTPENDNQFLRVGAEDTTSAAGGTFLRAIGQLESAFDRVAVELSGSWLLGIEVAPKDRDRKPHLVQVKVNRPGLEVRARKRYVIEPAPVTPTEVAPRPKPAPSPLAGVTATPSELEPLLDRAAAYVSDYQRTFTALTSVERQEMKLSRWKGTAGRPGSGEWALETSRVLTSDYLLVRLPSAAGWRGFRDVVEVDGQPVRERTNRLRALFLESPADIIATATPLDEESNKRQIAFVDRNVNAPTVALGFVLAPRAGMVFIGQGSDVVEGVRVQKVAFAERGARTMVQGEKGNLPAEGTLWIDPQQGRIVKSLMRLSVDETDVEITVTYRPTGEPGGIWVPTQIGETYLGPSVRFEVMSRYSDFRKFEVS
jgi:VWFA-related protein